MGIDGNQIDDPVARHGSLLLFIGTEPVWHTCRGCRGGDQGLDAQETWVLAVHSWTKAGRQLAWKTVC